MRKGMPAARVLCMALHNETAAMLSCSLRRFLTI